MPRNHKDTTQAPIEDKGPFIDIKEADASTDTKAKTVFGELIDVVQFAIMTAFGEGIDTIAKYGYGIKNYLSSTTIAGLDSFSYLIMVWLASVRVDKYKQRNSLFEDKNTPKYYTLESQALLAAMTKEEKDALFIQSQSIKHNATVTAVGAPDDAALAAYLILLIKHDTIALDETRPHTKGKKLITQAQLLFERIRKREPYVQTKYKELIDKFSLKDGYKTLAGETDSAKAILYTKISNAFTISGGAFSLEAAENLIAELTLIEKHWKSTLGLYETSPEKKFWSFVDQQLHTIKQKPYKDKEFNHELRLDSRIRNLFAQRGIVIEAMGRTVVDENALKAIKRFYKEFHAIEHLHDQNDQNYYKAQERGILAYEQERTQTKVKVFSWVRKMSLWAAPLSILLFFAVWINPAAAIASFIPLFMVGTTSLIDETVDIRYKYQKWRQSIAAMKSWKKDHVFTVTTQGKTIHILDKIKTLIEARDKVPEALSEYSAQELIFINAISKYDYYKDETQPGVMKYTHDRDTRKYLQDDISKAIPIINKKGNQKLIADYIRQSAQPLAWDEECRQYIEKHIKEINEYRFYEEGYIEGSDATDMNQPEKLMAAGMRYLEAQYKISLQYESRVARRETKLIQSCFSFNGVFWGVLASMAVHMLLLSATVLSAPIAMNAFNYIGFITIGIAAAASGIMINYQLNQNKTKAIQKNEEHYLHMNHIINPTLPSAPTAKHSMGHEKEKAIIASSENEHVNGRSVLRFSNFPDLRKKTRDEVQVEEQYIAMNKNKNKSNKTEILVNTFFNI